MLNSEEIDNTSEAVRDYLEQVPNRLMRWGSYILCVILFTLFIITWFLEYPDVIQTDLKLVSSTMPKPIIVRTNGRLERIFVKDNQKVRQGQIIGYIESTASLEEILSLEKKLNQLVVFTKTDENLVNLKKYDIKVYQNLGTIQKNYQDFQQVYIQSLVLFSQEYVKDKINILEKEINELSNLNGVLINQKELLNKDADIQNKEYKMNKTLHEKSVIASLQLDIEESKLISKKIPLKNIESLLINNNLSVQSKKKEILDFKKLVIEQKENFKQAINTLRSSITLWKKQYLLIAPNNGFVNFISSIQPKQELKENSVLMYVSNENSNNYFGEIIIPQENFGKVKIGQEVLIKLKAYPYEEFGVIKGKIKTIAKIPSQETNDYYAVVSIVANQNLANNNLLVFRNNMQAKAEIITKNRTLAERIFCNFKKNINR